MFRYFRALRNWQIAVVKTICSYAHEDKRMCVCPKSTGSLRCRWWRRRTPTSPSVAMPEIRTRPSGARTSPCSTQTAFQTPNISSVISSDDISTTKLINCSLLAGESSSDTLRSTLENAVVSTSGRDYDSRSVICHHLLVIPGCRTKFCKRALSFTAPCVWNSIPI